MYTEVKKRTDSAAEQVLLEFFQTEYIHIEYYCAIYAQQHKIYISIIVNYYPHVFMYWLYIIHQPLA